MVANIIANIPNKVRNRLSPLIRAAPVADKAPIIVTPLRAFIPLIRGVCSKLGTFLMTTYPKRVATIKTAIRIKESTVR